ncbi:P-loop containing nucleoside triphosphate hydrolase protein [Pisolithus orientalis]|uniref:P-loop containing nucleoside triphosphate hydrolase protein n=1 Tax=Pisolithus orientalis TaxID=936130 RepID=UPI00222438B4|nr:P-loop containing nucleoside triphosphate hydrolase protein [Pisolithus orientalis]KAI5989615.1 P-loop containing nucleoside triphosphate hydrolase protein [Pisolithus orientalis]
MSDRTPRSVMGATGSGKSTFINCASGSDLPVGKGLESCTVDVRTSKPFLLNGKIVTLIDTPGFDDTTRSDTDILSSIAAYLSNTYEHGAKLAGVIYMHRISDFRMGGTSKRNFRIFRELCGDNTLKNVIIVTNMWGNVDQKLGEAREKELTTNDKFFKPVLEKGARMMRHHGTQASAHTILRYLVNSQAATLAIQHELVNERRDLAHTAAGAELARALKDQANRHDEELKKLRSEMEAAMRSKDEETRQELQEEVDKKREEIERVKHDAERMAEAFNAEKARLEKAIRLVEEQRKREAEEQFTRLQSQIAEAEALRKQLAADIAEREAAERKRNAELQAELAEARREAESARTALRNKEPSPSQSFSLPIPFVVWRAAMAWLGGR